MMMIFFDDICKYKREREQEECINGGVSLKMSRANTSKSIYLEHVYVIGLRRRRDDSAYHKIGLHIFFIFFINKHFIPSQSNDK